MGCSPFIRAGRFAVSDQIVMKGGWAEDFSNTKGPSRHSRYARNADSNGTEACRFDERSVPGTSQAKRCGTGSLVARLFALDTNVLLNIYRNENATRQDLFRVLQRLSAG